MRRHKFVVRYYNDTEAQVLIDVRVHKFEVRVATFVPVNLTLSVFLISSYFYIGVIFVAPFQVMQNLGKADKTTDDVFEQHVTSFTDQQVCFSESLKSSDEL